jgi:group I intron endonuclease
MMKTGIYCIENLLNGNKYIGQSIHLEKRTHDSHKNCLAINGAVKKYGEESFKRYFVVLCEKWELDRLETECIKIFHSHVSECGYNISWGGNAPMRGRKLSPEHLEKISGENNYGFGKPRSAETRKKISESQKGEKGNNFGKPIPKETREKIWDVLYLRRVVRK